MKEKRKHERFEFDANCLLKSEGNISQVLLRDMSLSGALVTTDSDVTVVVDDSCHLILGDYSTECPLMRSSKVVRVEGDENYIGVSFTDENEPLVTYKP